MVTNIQLYIAIGLPVLTVLASLTLSIVQISGVRESMREIREDMREMRSEATTRFDLLMGRLTELEREIHRGQ